MLESIKCSTSGAYYLRGQWVPADAQAPAALAAAGVTAEQAGQAYKGTMAYGILTAHNTSGSDRDLRIKFDAMASHDITFVGIIQTARASGLEKFPIPYVLTNCHNSLCAVGGTINEDDHRFGLSAAKKYGGIFVPPHMAVIHQYMRERFAGCGKMILGSDSHTRYGALGTMAIGEGGGELAKQLLGRTYDVARPGVVAICLTGALPAGCGPHDVAIALVGELFKSGYVKNKVMEFVGPGIASLRQDTRNAIDAMTTETTCLSSIWETDEKTRQFLTVHGRAGDYKPLHPAELAYYDGVVSVDLSKIRPMIALPMHPSNAFPIEELNANLKDILHECEENVQKLVGRSDVKLDLCSKIENGRLRVYQGFGHGDYDALLKLGPNIKDWPEIAPLGDNLLLKVASYITDPVTTTDELIPSGETSSYRSNPLGLAEFTLSRKDPAYVGRAKAVQAEEAARRAGQGDAALLAKIRAVPGCEALTWDDVQLASTIFAVKPGDGSAREQAASCQRVLGAGANIVNEYATKRYRSNLINWGMLPFQLNGAAPFGLGDYILIPHVREALKGDLQNIPAYVLGEEVKPFALYMAPLTSDEREILADGCLINYYKR